MSFDGPTADATVKGTIQDKFGNPVEGIAVLSAVSRTPVVTGPDGKYEIGVSSQFGELITMGGTLDFSIGVDNADIIVGPGETATKDITLPHISVMVYGYSPVQNAPVKFNDKLIYTNKMGVARFVVKRLDLYDIVVQNEYTTDTYIGEPASVKQFVLMPGEIFGGGVTGGVPALILVRLKIVDEETGEPVRNVDVVRGKTGMRTLSDEDGVAQVFPRSNLLEGENDEIEFDLIVASEDNRYEKETVSMSVEPSASAIETGLLGKRTVSLRKKNSISTH